MPIETLLRGFPSPVPTQTMSGLAWLTAMAPIEATGWSSKTGVQLRPPLIDFQTPPAAPPAYMTSGLDSTTSRAGRRPLMVAGPIEPGREAGEQVRIDRLGRAGGAGAEA